MATRRIREFLTGSKVSFATIDHKCAFTASEVAESSHVPGRYMAKTIVVNLDGRLALVVVAATQFVDLKKLRHETGAAQVHLADESDFRDQFDGCQIGAVPPFGNLFGIETYMDRGLVRQEHIAFNAGTHTTVFVVRYCDYVRLAGPRVIDAALDNSTINRRRRDADGQVQPDSLFTKPLPQAQCGRPVEDRAGAD